MNEYVNSAAIHRLDRAGSLLLICAVLCSGWLSGGCHRTPSAATQKPAKTKPPLQEVRPSTRSATPSTIHQSVDWSVPPRYRGAIIRHRLRYFPDKLLALTFDDGPDPIITPQVLRILSESQAHATFFVRGDCARRHPELLRQEQLAGHVIGSHSYSHPARVSASEAAQQLNKTATIILQATGKRPTLYRPPYGITSNQLSQLALRQGYALILWTISSADTRRVAPEVLANNVIHTPNPGDIIIMHDGAGHVRTVEALPMILRELTAAGFRFETVPDLLRAWEKWHERNLPSGKSKAIQQANPFG